MLHIVASFQLFVYAIIKTISGTNIPIYEFAAK